MGSYPSKNLIHLGFSFAGSGTGPVTVAVEQNLNLQAFAKVLSILFRFMN